MGRGLTARTTLTIILLLVFVKQLAWLSALPIWQSPDEPAHFHYVQYLAETGRIPTYRRDRPYNAPSEEAAYTELNASLEAVAYKPNNRPVFTKTMDGPGETRLSSGASLSRSNDGNSTAAVYAPGYYFPAALIYRVFDRFNVVDRVFAVRSLSTLFVLVITALAFALAGVIWPSLLIRAAFALFVGFQPMLSMLGVSVNNDAMLIALSSALVLFLAFQVKAPFSFVRGAGMGVVVGLGMLTKPQMMVFVAIVPSLLMALGLWRKTSFSDALRHLAGFALAVGSCFIPWLLFCRGTYGTWLPPLPGAATPRDLSAFQYAREFILQAGTTRFHELWVIQYWGKFGWLDTTVGHWAYEVLGFVGWAGTVATLFILTRRASGSIFMIGSLFISFAYLAFLYVVEFQMVKATGMPVLQGRYWLPALLPTATVLFGGFIHVTPPSRRAWTAVALAGIGMVFNVACFLRLIERFYV